MRVPTETEYAEMLGRLKNVMDFASEEIETLRTGIGAGLSAAAAEDINRRLLRLLTDVTFRVGNDENDPVPAGLPSIADTSSPPVP